MCDPDAPDDAGKKPQKGLTSAQNPSSAAGKAQSAKREARLADALRANLRRRKTPEPQKRIKEE